MNFEFLSLSRSALRYLGLRLFAALLGGLLVAGNLALASGMQVPAHRATTDSQQEPAAPSLISNPRQLTFEGLRTGEGYFRLDGSKMVFQSERQEGNPFYQIYMLDMETGDTQRISPGVGKTTCAWIHPERERVLFASTHEDPQAEAKQVAELKMRESGEERRYAWDYDEHFDIYAYDLETKSYTNLTNTRGYDAEGSYSPDGEWIAFASNRRAYSDPLDDRQARLFEVDQSFMMDIYLMRADGSEVQQLTTEAGYDGGPFFSPDGKRICWRHFSEDGLRAEIWTMNIDGSDKRQLTRLGAMSWAPYYHPSGQYIIFNTNVHGFSNFELYLVATDGRGAPVRVTDSDGFDGLASFSPDGKQITWTSNRRDKRSQLFMGDWDHDQAMRLVGDDATANGNAAGESASSASADCRPEDILRHVQVLCKPEMEGRLTGTRGERLATEYVATYFESLGFVPAGDAKTDKAADWFQYFEFPSGTRLGQNNRLLATASPKELANPAAWPANDSAAELDRDWRPLTFSGVGEFSPAGVVFAGYGIVAPKSDEFEEYDSYVHLDVEDKWVLVFRYLPEQISAEQRQHLQYFSTLRRKARAARDRGARGLIIVSGPSSKVRQQLIPLQGGSSRDAISMPVISVTDELASAWLLAGANKDLAELQDGLDTGEPSMGIQLAGIQLGATIEIDQQIGTGRNVVARMQAGDEPSAEVIVIGAHIDHLGRGNSGSSLARESELGQIHHGADDNASGVAAMMEIAEYLAAQKKSGKLAMRRDIVFAAWSGEELNLYGSKHFVAQLQAELAHAHGGHAAGHGGGESSHGDQSHGSGAHGSGAHGSESHGSGAHGGTASPAVASDAAAANHPHAALLQAPGSIYPQIAAYVNLDMVGRFDKSLILQGLGSSDYWRPVIERRNVVVQLNLKLSDDTNLPTDAREFYSAGVPILAAFTGSHSDYHSPRDTPEKLNYDKAADIARLLALISRDLVTAESIPEYKEYQQAAEINRGGLRATLGTVPDYAGGVTGVLLGDARKGSPAEKAGIRSGDIVVELAGKKIENIYDYTDAINALKVGQKVKIVVIRDEKRMELDITPVSRD